MAAQIDRDKEVALRKESVDRNTHVAPIRPMTGWSLSARRAWIEMSDVAPLPPPNSVALRKESVDRNSLASGP